MRAAKRAAACMAKRDDREKSDARRAALALKLLELTSDSERQALRPENSELRSLRRRIRRASQAKSDPS